MGICTLDLCGCHWKSCLYQMGWHNRNPSQSCSRNLASNLCGQHPDNRFNHCSGNVALGKLMWAYGSIAILYYPLGAEEVPPPGTGFLLITDGSELLMTDNTPLLTAGP